LIATAVANAQSTAELRATRSRLVAASDEVRRRIERDLHDGAQQHLVGLALKLRMAADTADDSPHTASVIRSVADDLLTILQDLREMAHGIYPALLSRCGLAMALRALARRAMIPTEVNAEIDRRLPAPIEVGVYYIVSELLANAGKHAQASVLQIDVRIVVDRLVVRVRDDGVGGADSLRGSGLTGLADRAEALGGTFDIDSPAARGTTVHIELPAGPDHSD
jgi:signal transduction histidine kinase